MLLPERSKDRAVFEGRPVWSVVEGGVLRRREADASRLADLDRGSLVVARRRHEAWHGPIAAFVVAPELRLGRLIELVDVDVCPWQDEDAARVFDLGLASVLEYARRFALRSAKRRRDPPMLEGIAIPEGLGGPRVKEWLDGLAR